MGKPKSLNSSRKFQSTTDNYLSDIESNTSNKCCTKENFFKFCKKFITFLISRVGLMIAMVGYVLGGGFIFEAIESEYENQALKLSESVVEKMLHRIYKQIESNSTRVKDDAFYSFLRYEIRTFGDFFTNATLNGTLTGSIERQWDYFGSVFYCVTLVSTIGYGHISCKTKLGKIVTIIYSSIGIPLMMLFLANTGSSTATVFKFIYTRINSIKRGIRNRKLNRLNKKAWKNFEMNEFQEEFEDAYNENLSINQIQERNSSYNENQEKFYEYKPNLKETNNNCNKVDISSAGLKKNQECNQKLAISETENKSNKPKKKSKIKKLIRQHSISVSVGIRSVDIPFEFIQTLIKSNKNQNNSNNNSQLASKEDRSKLNQNALNSSKINKDSIKKNDTKSNKSNVFEALKKIDNLIEENESFDFDLEKDISLEKNLDNYKLNDNDEDLKSVENFQTNDYLISNIFNSNTLNNKNTKTIINQNNQAPQRQPFKSSSLNEKKSRKNTTDTTKLSISKSDLVLHKQTQESKQNTNLSIRPNLNDKLQRVNSANLHSSYSSDYNLDERRSKLKRRSNTTRSMHSYDFQMILNQNTFNNNKSIKRPLSKCKSNQIPIYSTKQLNLIYKQYKQDRQDRVGVPVFYTLIIMTVYLICGMLIFSSYEKWKKLDALYFCFVTLTTIGFGDLIPGSTLLNKNANKKSLYISALYIFVGLILIAMCINLVKTQIKLKIKSIARKIGLSNC